MQERAKGAVLMHGELTILGRKRKTTVIRDKNGKSRGEPERVAAEVVQLRQRHLLADGISPIHALDALAGFSLGKLRLRGRSSPGNPGSITEKQFQAGEAWCKIVHRHAAIMGYSLTTPSPAFAMVGVAIVGGRGASPEPDKETVARVRKEWVVCYNALMQASREAHAPVWKITYGVVIENWPVSGLSSDDYGNLRTGLNSLARVLG